MQTMATEKCKGNRKLFNFGIIFIAFLMILSPLFPSVSARQSTVVDSSGYTYDAYANITKYEERPYWENRIINDEHYYGPMNTFVRTGGWYLGFIRQGTSHVSAGDYGVAQLYRSVDGGILWSQISPSPFPFSVANRDVRNFACGETQTGRIIFVYTIYDCDNQTFPESETQIAPMEYIYSDNNGISWSGRNAITLPTLNYFTPTGASPFGTIKQINNNEIGFCYHPWDTSNGSVNSTQIRFAYSNDDGATWNHAIMGNIVPEWNRTEADFVYIGDSRMIALARMESTDGPQMYTSTDNGRNWTSRGTLGKRFAPATSASLALCTDDKGQLWVFAMFYHWASFDYSFGNANDLMVLGRNEWNQVIHAEDMINVGAFPVFSMENNVGFMMASQESSPTTAFVLLYNITLALIQHDVQTIWYGFIWLFIVFIPAIAMNEIIPKIGFAFGMVIILCILAGTESGFLSVSMVGITAVGIMLYKER